MIHQVSPHPRQIYIANHGSAWWGKNPDPEPQPQLPQPQPTSRPKAKRPATSGRWSSLPACLRWRPTQSHQSLGTLKCWFKYQKLWFYQIKWRFFAARSVVEPCLHPYWRQLFGIPWAQVKSEDHWSDPEEFLGSFFWGRGTGWS